LAQGGSPGTAPRQRSSKPRRGERGGGPVESDYLSPLRGLFLPTQPHGSRRGLASSASARLLSGERRRISERHYAQFDSSGNGPIRERVVRAVSPHPDPLPQGEGTAPRAQRIAGGPGLFSAQRRVQPSPRERAGVRGKKPLHGAAPRSAAWRADNARRAACL
jgi:hypothetical protein